MRNMAREDRRLAAGSRRRRRGFGLTWWGEAWVTALEERAREELSLAGARPRRPQISGLEALTASERRVAELAAGGATNREVAQSLFVTVKTVEVHLSHVYRKLDIGSRRQLSAAFGAPATEPVGTP